MFDKNSRVATAKVGITCGGDERMDLSAPPKASRDGVVIFDIAVFAIAFAVVAVCWNFFAGSLDFWAVIVAFVLALFCEATFNIALSWEKVVVLRFGKLNRVVGPGLYLTIPIFESGTLRVDQRTIATPFCAERTLSADLVPLDIDAVLYWVVWDAEKACMEVEDYYSSVVFLAQAALRDAVGRSMAAEVALRRNQLDQDIEKEIENMAASWGIDIIAVKVRDIVIPQELQEKMSLEAQADREQVARASVASVEKDIAEMLKEAADVYGNGASAFEIRKMLQQYETVRESKSSVVTVPTALSDSIAKSISGNEA